MSWFRKKKVRFDPELELARYFVADLFDSTRRAEGLVRLIGMLEIPGVNLYDKGTRISSKRLISIARGVAENFTVIAIEMNPRGASNGKEG